MNFKILGLFILVIIVAVGAYTLGSSSGTSNSVQPTTPPVENDVVQNKSVTKSFFEVHEITTEYQELLGKTISTRGIVQSLNEGKGNVFFELKDPQNDSTIKGVLFAKTNSDNAGRKDVLLQSRDTGAIIYLKGEIDVYKGELEIKAWKVQDFEF
ncbi:MAG: exodeoxyribonuclease VII large subunit [Selenomonadaceae bacterium]|nr:exodeoxyribonuclease VII large subunit [Selenomonadaceae bacterium]